MHETDINSLKESTFSQLTAEDENWLANFGVDPTWSDNSLLLKEIHSAVSLGSLHIDESDNITRRSEIIAAREKFFDFIGIAPSALDAFQKIKPDTMPLDTFIGTQRVLSSLGLDNIKIVHEFPAAIGLAPKSVYDKVANFTDLGLDAIKIINTSPSAIGYALDSVRDKVANFTDLGLDAIKIINTSPSAINLSLDSVRDKVANFTDLGLDAIKIINKLPSAISYALDSVRDKVANFTDLGLDAIKIINAYPAAIGFAPKSVQNKVRLLERTSTILKWDFSAKELIEVFPAILGFNTEKLLILSRIAAVNLPKEHRSLEPKSVRSHLFIPLEKIILSLDSENNDNFSFESPESLLKRAKVLKLEAPERRKQARELALTGKLGHLGIMYLRYAKK